MTAALLLLAFAQSARESYQSASRHFDQKQFADADREVNEALHADPAYVPALTLKAKLALASNRRDVALSCLRTAVAEQPRAEYPQFLLGFVLYLENDFLKALVPLEAARTLKRDDPMPVFYLALSKEGLGKAEEAVALYGEAAGLSPAKDVRRAEILVAYGRLLFAMGRYDESLDRIREALECDAESREGHYRMGQLWFQRHKYEDSAREAELALAKPAVGTSDAEVHFLLGRVYLKLGKRELADQHLRAFHAAPASVKR